VNVCLLLLNIQLGRLATLSLEIGGSVYVLLFICPIRGSYLTNVIACSVTQFLSWLFVSALVSELAGDSEMVNAFR
jgi:hypothetical protein